MMDKKNEEDGHANLYLNLDKTSVLQEARAFSETPVNVKRCNLILTKVLYLLNQGEHLGTTEATELFFAITKLFQSKDMVLRRLVYLGIKELASVADDVIIVTSSLTKDMTGREDLYRAAAIRALCCITDATMLQAIERYMKQAIVDRTAGVSCAALVSSMHLLSRSSGDVVKRWSNEVQEALTADSAMTQYHALGLLYHIRRTDRLAVTKLVAKLTRAAPRSPHAVCLLLRITCRLMADEGSGVESPLFRFLESCLRHKSEMVVYEAVRAIFSTRGVTSRELVPVVSTLQMYLSSSRPSLNFAAVRTLNQVAISHPSVVASCNIDLEALISDPNRSIATLAITTLLKTGAESSVDRLMKQISTFVADISDEFKIVVVNAIKAFCLKFPRKHGVLMNFLSSMLRDEGGLDYKASIADTIITIIEHNPEAKETGLSHLCEFIEDCEHVSLAVRILHLLGREGPKTKQPSKYIRFIYNRVILESVAVRAAAVSALARFGALCDDLLANVLVLLRRCQLDSDDEVRDRATYYYTLLDQQQPTLNTHLVLSKLHVSLAGLERALVDYCRQPDSHNQPFDMASVPLAAPPTSTATNSDAITTGTAGEVEDRSSSGPAASTATTRQDVFAEQLAKVEQLRAAGELGPLFKSSQPVDLTEPETEYVVQCIKHVFPDHLVLQFDCTNTLSDQLLEQVHVQLQLPEEWQLVASVPCERLEYNVSGTCYLLVRLPRDPATAVAVCGASLHYNVRDCDPSTGQPDSQHSYPDEYSLEDVEVCLADHVQRVPTPDFQRAWDQLGETNELCDSYCLSAAGGSLNTAVSQVCQFLGMQPCERSDHVPAGRSSHQLMLSGQYRGESDAGEVLVRARLAAADGTVTMQLTVRAAREDVAEAVAAAVG